jgi:hypothetical protein
MTFKTTLLIVAGLSAGTALGWQLRGVNTSSPSVTVAESRSIEAATFKPDRASSDIDIDQLRQVVREELIAARAAADGPSAASTAQRPVTPELIAQRRAAVDEIETMIRGGEWGNEQRATFHQRMTQLDPDQAARVLREVTIAFNQGTMRVTTDGPPL